MTIVCTMLMVFHSGAATIDFPSCNLCEETKIVIIEELNPKEIKCVRVQDL